MAASMCNCQHNSRGCHGNPFCNRYLRPVCLAARVVPWHNFNLFGFSPISPEACHSEYQGSRRQAETFCFWRCRIRLLGQAARCQDTSFLFLIWDAR
jgi:hypothetical protein